MKRLLSILLTTILHVVVWGSQLAGAATLNVSLTDSIDRADGVEVNELREITVRARRPVTPKQNISRMQIESLPSANVADALKYLAGVQIKDYGGLGGQKTVNVRSLGSQHVGVYLDGVRITNAQNGTEIKHEEGTTTGICNVNIETSPSDIYRIDGVRTDRGYAKNSLNSNGGWNVTSALSWLNTPILTYASEIESPVLVLHGENAHSRYFGEDAFKLLKGDNKQLVIVPGATHCDLYDGGANHNMIPWHTVVEFFNASLL